MGRDDRPIGLVALLGTPVVVALSIFVVHLLPNSVLTILMAWVVASLPIGVLIGHCVLSEE
jgi:hypothetical protein